MCSLLVAMGKKFITLVLHVSLSELASESRTIFSYEVHINSTL